MSPLKNTQGEKGFIALTSALVISSVLVILIFTTSASTFYARFDALDSEHKRISLGLSESCTNAALLKIAQNYNYAPAVGGDVVAVGPDTCLIKSVTYSQVDVATPMDVKKKAIIQTSAQYPVVNGSWSTTRVQAIVSSPETSVAVPAPSCVLQASPASVPQGKMITVQWSATNNTTSFTLTPVPTPAIDPSEAQGGSRNFMAVGVGPVTYTGVAYNGAIPSNPCEATVTVVPPPPAPACADTVMMLDRTGSMTAADLNNEEAAAHQLIDLYAGVSSFPKIGAGSFPGLDGNPASVPVSPYGQLPATTPAVAGDYPILKNTVTQITNAAGGFTDLSAAITKGYQELNSVRHTPGFRKVLILVSDGEVNRPTGNVANDTQLALSAADTAKINNVDIFSIRYSQNTNAAATLLLAQIASGTTPYVGPGGPHLPGADDNSISPTNADTGTRNPSSTHTPNSWTSANNAFTDDVTYATDSTNGHQQGYSSFTFNVPAGSNIRGIETSVKGLVTAPTLSTATLFPSGQGTYTTWTGDEDDIDETGSASCGAADGNENIATATTGNRESALISLSAVPDGATITSVDVIATYRNGDTGGADNGTFQTFARLDGVNVDSGTNLVATNNTCTSGTQTVNVVDTTKNVGTTLEVGVLKTANDTSEVWVGTIRAIVRYTTEVASGTCDVGVNLSWDNGGTWSDAKTITLDDTEGSYTVGSPTDHWGGHTWQQSELSNTNFVFRLTNNSCSGTKAASVNHVSAKVHYTTNAYNPDAENNDGDNYFITPSTDLASITTIFETIGRRVCPAAAPACSNTVDDDGDGAIDYPADASCTDANDNNEWTVPPVPPPPAPPPPPSPISIGSWDEIISPGP